MRRAKELLGAGAAAGSVAVVVVVLAVSDASVFREEDISPLYQATLDRAYSRFESTDVIMAAGRRQSQNPFEEESVEEGVPRQTKPPANPLESPEYKEAEALAGQGKHREAITLLEKLARRHPKSLFLQHRIADLLKEQGKWREAINEYRGILKVNPEYLCCFDHIGDLFAANDKPDMARKMYDNVLAGFERVSRKPGPEGQQARLDLVRYHIKYGRDLEKAAGIAEGVVKDDPKAVSGREILALCYEQLARPEKALDVLSSIESDDAELLKRIQALRDRLGAALRNGEKKADEAGAALPGASR